jgi:hypothetical protein
MLSDRKSNLSQYEFKEHERKLEFNCNKALKIEKLRNKKQKSLGHQVEAIVTKNLEKLQKN